MFRGRLGKDQYVIMQKSPKFHLADAMVRMYARSRRTSGAVRSACFWIVDRYR